MLQFPALTADCRLDLIHPTHIHVNVLGHTPTPFLSVESCHLRLFPGESHSLQTFLDYASPVCPWPTGSLLKLGASQYNAWCVMRRWSICIVWPSQRSLLPLRVFRMLCCPVLALTSSLVALSFQEKPNMLLSHLWWTASSRFDSVTVSGQSSAMYRRVDKMTDSYRRIFTFKLILLFFQIFLIFPKLVAAFPMRTLTFFSQLPLYAMYLPR